MNINFFYPDPKGSKARVHWFRYIFRVSLWPMLKEKGYNVKFSVLDKYGDQPVHKGMYYIENDLTKDYIVVDTADNVAHQEHIHNPKCIKIFRSQYSNKQIVYPKVQPFIYGVFNFSKYDQVYKTLREERKLDRELWFAGAKGSSDFRSKCLKHLAKNKRIELSEKRMAVEDYLKKIAETKICLSLKGIGRMCYREMEAYGIGTPVMMFDNGIKLHNPLVPNEHYISLGKEPVKEAEAAHIIYRKYTSIIKEQAFLNKIRKNAMDYFDSTWEPDNRATNILNLLKIEDLF